MEIFDKKDFPDTPTDKQARKLEIDARALKDAHAVRRDGYEKQMGLMERAENEKYQARRIGVVAPGFSEGYIRETAKKRGIVLIETEAICMLLKNHVIYPYETNQIVEILFKSDKDIITSKDIPPSTVDQEQLIEIVAKILSDIKLTRKNSFSSKELDIAYSWQDLDYKFNEIENALIFLSVAPFSILKKHNDEYSLTGDIDSILKKVGLLLQAFNKTGGII